jgi:hypothetical protein
MGDSIGPGDFSSVQALQQLIKEKNSCISVMDEFGSFLRRIKDGAQMSNVREITGEMRTLWSSWIQYDSVKKAHDDSVRVYSPAFAIFGVTTAGDFYSALKIEDASNGFLNRSLILEETSRGEEKEPRVGWMFLLPSWNGCIRPRQISIGARRFWACKAAVQTRMGPGCF